MHKKKGVLVLLALSIFLIVESVRLQLPVAMFGNGDLESMEIGISMTPDNADLNFRIGRTYHNLMLEDENKVTSLFANSLQNNPLLASSWLELSEIFVDKGESDKSLVALNRAHELAPLSIARLWQGSILALRLGEENRAYNNFKIVATADPSLRTTVFDTIWLVTGDNDFILNNIIAEEVLLSYMDYLIATKRADASLAVWDKIESMNEIDVNKNFLNYMNFLIDNQKSRQAHAIWSKIVGRNESESLVWNGGFELKPLNAGFDWRITTDNNPGVLMDRDSEKSVEGELSFKVEFDGKNNNEFYHLSQIVPVEPNAEYLFTAKVKTENITTQNGISMETHCYPDWKLMSKSTKPLTGTNDWTNVSMRLETPESCNDLLIRVRRFQSDNFDKFISGTAWIDDVKIIDLGNS